MTVKIDVGDDNPAAAPCGVAGEVVCGIFASLFCVVFLSAGQCAAGNSSAFVPDETIAGDRSTSNADRWIENIPFLRPHKTLPLFTLLVVITRRE